MAQAMVPYTKQSMKRGITFSDVYFYARLILVLIRRHTDSDFKYVFKLLKMLNIEKGA
jgi:hypothetical protein